MNIKEKILLHNRCVQLLEAIEKFERRKELKKDFATNFVGIPIIRLKILNEINIIDLCIARLKNTYIATKKKL